MIPVTTSHLSVAYNGTRAVEDLDFWVDAGSWLALIGPNGAGKTTVLRSVAGLVTFEGDVAIGSIAVRGASRRTLARAVAYVPQRPIVPSGATVTDYVLMGRNPYISYFSTEAHSDLVAVREVLKRLDLEGFATREVSSLSGGETQRVVIARAIAQEASVLLLDEPTSELDIGHQQQVLELVDRLRRDVGLTVVSTMHDLTLAGQYAVNFLLLDKGSAVASGSAADVLRPDLISRYYGASVEVLTGPSGVVIVPRRLETKEVTR
jgi:iron complex transport system ATP-binding protein